MAKSLGLPVNNRLPPVDGRLRPLSAIIERALCLNVVAAVSYGLLWQAGRKWVEREGLWLSLTPAEREFLTGPGLNATNFRGAVQSLYALAWVLGLATPLSPTSPVPQDFYKVLPDLKSGESSERFRARVHGITESEALGALDIFYCVHWGVREAGFSGSPARFEGLDERRHALEWAMSTVAWDEVSLDT